VICLRHECNTHAIERSETLLRPSRGGTLADLQVVSRFVYRATEQLEVFRAPGQMESNLGMKINHVRSKSPEGHD
jgi:hypothetical protein